MQSRSRVIAAIIFLALIMAGGVFLAGCSGGGGGGGGDIVTPSPSPTPASTKWTFLVYLCSDNNLEYYGYKDVKEMEKVGSNDEVKIVVQWDRNGFYDDSVDWTGCRRYLIQKDPDNQSGIVSTMVEDLGDTNMGSAVTLESFINWGMENYPADRYAVILWDHGDGWKDLKKRIRVTKAICEDESSGDALTTVELRDAFSTTMYRVDLVGMDACLMGNLEVAYEIRNYADILVFSEEKEDGNGWPYDTILQDLVDSPTMSAAALGTAIVDRYGEYYSTFDRATQSAIDLSQMDNVATALNDFANEAINEMANYKTEFETAKSNARGMSGFSEYRDLGDFCSEVNTNVPDADIQSKALALQNAVNSAVISYYANPSVASEYIGLTIWLPSQFQFNNLQTQYTLLQFSQDTTWDEFLDALLN